MQYSVFCSCYTVISAVRAKHSSAALPLKHTICQHALDTR